MCSQQQLDAPSCVGCSSCHLAKAADMSCLQRRVRAPRAPEPMLMSGKTPAMRHYIVYTALRSEPRLYITATCLQSQLSSGEPVHALADFNVLSKAWHLSWLHEVVIRRAYAKLGPSSVAIKHMLRSSAVHRARSFCRHAQTQFMQCLTMALDAPWA